MPGCTFVVWGGWSLANSCLGNHTLWCLNIYFSFFFFCRCRLMGFINNCHFKWGTVVIYSFFMSSAKWNLEICFQHGAHDTRRLHPVMGDILDWYKHITKHRHSFKLSIHFPQNFLRYNETNTKLDRFLFSCIFAKKKKKKKVHLLFLCIKTQTESLCIQFSSGNWSDPFTPFFQQLLI